MSKFDKIFGDTKPAKGKAQKGIETRRGRPSGKRSNPEYEQVTAYIRSETYAQTKIALLKEGKRRDFSGLVEELLGEWLKSRR